jgi:hypothetical protein
MEWETIARAGFFGGPIRSNTDFLDQRKINMKKTLALAVLVAVGGGLAYWGASRHVVMTEQGVIVLAKRFLTYADTAVDVRPWSSDEFEAHPELKRALIDQGYQDLLEQLKARERKAAFDELAAKADAMAEQAATQISQAASDVAAEVSEAAGDAAAKASEITKPWIGGNADSNP